MLPTETHFHMPGVAETYALGDGHPWAMPITHDALWLSWQDATLGARMDQKTPAGDGIDDKQQPAVTANTDRWPGLFPAPPNCIAGNTAQPQLQTR